MKKNEHWNTDQIRQYNRSLVLKLIYKKGPVSKAEIAKRSELTFATIGNITSELLEIEAIRESGYGKSNGGRRPVLYEFNWDNYYVIALDIGVTQITAALVNFKGSIYKQYEVNMSDFTDSIRLIERVYTVVDHLISHIDLSLSKIVGIGVSAPGPIDEDDGKILTPPNLQCVKNVN